MKPAGLVRKFLRLASPAYRAGDFRAKPDDGVPMDIGKGDGEQACGFGTALARRIDAAEVVRLVDLAAALMEPAGQGQDLFLVGGVACGPALVLADHRHAGGVGQLEQCRVDLDQTSKRRIALRHLRNDLQREAFRLAAGLDGIVLFFRLDLKREQLAEVITGSPGFEIEPAWLVVMAGDESPQIPPHDDRDRHRSQGSHVAHVLEMDGRDAAQLRERKIEGARAQRAIDEVKARSQIVGVGYDPDAVQQIEGAGLRRNVGRGEGVPDVRLVAGCHFFRQDPPMALVVERIHHAAPEASQCLHFRGGDQSNLRQRQRLLEQGKKASREGIDGCLRASLRGGRFQLQQVEAAGPMDSRIQQTTANRRGSDRHRARARDRCGEPWAQVIDGGLQTLGQLRSRLDVVEVAPVLAIGDDAAGFSFARRKPAVRLNGARHPNGFAGAGCQVNRGQDHVAAS